MELARDLGDLVGQVIHRDSLELIGIPPQAKMVAKIFFGQVKIILDRNVEKNLMFFLRIWTYLELFLHTIRYGEQGKERAEQRKNKNYFAGVNIIDIHEAIAIEHYEIKIEFDIKGDLKSYLNNTQSTAIRSPPTTALLDCHSEYEGQ